MVFAQRHQLYIGELAYLVIGYDNRVIIKLNMPPHPFNVIRKHKEAYTGHILFHQACCPLKVFLCTNPVNRNVFRREVVASADMHGHALRTRLNLRPYCIKFLGERFGLQLERRNVGYEPLVIFAILPIGLKEILFIVFYPLRDYLVKPHIVMLRQKLIAIAEKSSFDTAVFAETTMFVPRYCCIQGV